MSEVRKMNELLQISKELQVAINNMEQIIENRSKDIPVIKLKEMHEKAVSEVTPYIAAIFLSLFGFLLSLALAFHLC